MSDDLKHPIAAAPAADDMGEDDVQNGMLQFPKTRNLGHCSHALCRPEVWAWRNHGEQKSVGLQTAASSVLWRRSL